MNNYDLAPCVSVLIGSHELPSVPACCSTRLLARHLILSMEATQSYPNLLSEKQAAARLGVARITLLRAREAGRIRFFRIGTRVLYCEEQLTEFLTFCERNGRNEHDGAGPEPEPHAAKRKDNQVSQSR